MNNINLDESKNMERTKRGRTNDLLFHNLFFCKLHIYIYLKDPEKLNKSLTQPLQGLFAQRFEIKIMKTWLAVEFWVDLCIFLVQYPCANLNINPNKTLEKPVANQSPAVLIFEDWWVPSTSLVPTHSHLNWWSLSSHLTISKPFCMLLSFQDHQR